MLDISLFEPDRTAARPAASALNPIAIYCIALLKQPKVGRASYGRFRFALVKVVKWNCVFRIRNPEGVPAGKHALRMFLVEGPQEDVRTTMIALSKPRSGTGVPPVLGAQK
jgi:hypothetical protein